MAAAAIPAVTKNQGYKAENMRLIALPLPLKGRLYVGGNNSLMGDALKTHGICTAVALCSLKSLRFVGEALESKFGQYQVELIELPLRKNNERSFGRILDPSRQPTDLDLIKDDGTPVPVSFKELDAYVDKILDKLSAGNVFLNDDNASKEKRIEILGRVAVSVLAKANHLAQKQSPAKAAYQQVIEQRIFPDMHDYRCQDAVMAYGTFLNPKEDHIGEVDRYGLASRAMYCMTGTQFRGCILGDAYVKDEFMNLVADRLSVLDVKTVLTTLLPGEDAAFELACARLDIAILRCSIDRSGNPIGGVAGVAQSVKQMESALEKGNLLIRSNGKKVNQLLIMQCFKETPSYRDKAAPTYGERGMDVDDILQRSGPLIASLQQGFVAQFKAHLAREQQGAAAK
jgi:hypothetical protein